MDGRTLDELFLKQRQLYVRLVEFEDLTMQLANAVDRRDEVSVQMLLDMREEPAHRLQEVDQGLRRRLLELPEEDAIRALEILEGGAHREPAEERLCQQVSQNKRLIERCVELDKRISLRMDGARSIYSKYR